MKLAYRHHQFLHQHHGLTNPTLIYTCYNEHIFPLFNIAKVSYTKKKVGFLCMTSNGVEFDSMATQSLYTVVSDLLTWITIIHRYRTARWYTTISFGKRRANVRKSKQGDRTGYFRYGSNYVAIHFGHELHASRRFVQSPRFCTEEQYTVKSQSIELYNVSVTHIWPNVSDYHVKCRNRYRR
jgi:hypothetical protein